MRGSCRGKQFCSAPGGGERPQNPAITWIVFTKRAARVASFHWHIHTAKKVNRSLATHHLDRPLYTGHIHHDHPIGESTQYQNGCPILIIRGLSRVRFPICCPPLRLATVHQLTDEFSTIFNDFENAAKLFPVPVMQCLQIKKMAPSAQGGDRYRLVMSDGKHYVQTMLATQANHVVHDGKLDRGCIARVKSYNPNNLKGKKWVRTFIKEAGCILTDFLAFLLFLISKSSNHWECRRR